MPAKLLISDANVIIDMEVGGLIEQMFTLDYEFAVVGAAIPDISWFSSGYQQVDIAASGCLPIDCYYRFLYRFSHENYSRY
ncbi:MAG: hypothetical protein ACYCRH_11490 [Acidiferrobacteraceae bacterium]